jgi:hypothetical protein
MLLVFFPERSSGSVFHGGHADCCCQWTLVSCSIIGERKKEWENQMEVWSRTPKVKSALVLLASRLGPSDE